LTKGEKLYNISSGPSKPDAATVTNGGSKPDELDDENSGLLSETVRAVSIPRKSLARTSKSLVHVDQDHLNGLLVPTLFSPLGKIS
jgi:hypothetical protein